MSDKWKNILKKVVPTLGAALGGPLAGVALAALGETLLGKSTATEKEIEEALSVTSPETLIKLRELDQAFAAKMKSLDIDVYKLEVEDRASARGLYAVNYWPQIILSGAFMFGYFTTLILLLLGEVKIEPEWKDVLMIIIGVITANIPTIMQFWFGSSFGSREKTAALQNSMPVPINGNGK
jgi:hypothetical protein